MTKEPSILMMMIREDTINLKKLLNQRNLDFGCGWGGFLYLSKNISKSTEGYEIMKSV